MAAGATSTPFNIVISARDLASAAMRGVGTTAQQVGQIIGRAFSGLTGIFRSVLGSIRGFMSNGLVQLAGALGVATSVGALAAQLNEARNEMELLGRTAVRLDMPVGELSAMKYAAESTGVQFDQLKDAIKTLRVSAGNSHESFKLLGVATRDVNGAVKSSSVLFDEVSQKLTALQDPLLKAKVTNDLFGESGLLLATTFKEGFASMTDRAQRFGVVLTEVETNNAASFNSALADIGYALKGLNYTFLREVMPALTGALNGLAEWIADNRDQVVQWVKTWLTADNIANVAATVAQAAVFLFYTLNSGIDANSILLLTWERAVFTAALGIGKALHVILNGALFFFGDFTVALTSLLYAGEQALNWLAKGVVYTRDQLARLRDVVKYSFQGARLAVVEALQTISGDLADWLHDAGETMRAFPGTEALGAKFLAMSETIGAGLGKAKREAEKAIQELGYAIQNPANFPKEGPLDAVIRETGKGILQLQTNLKQVQAQGGFDFFNLGQTRSAIREIDTQLNELQARVLTEGTKGADAQAAFAKIEELRTRLKGLTFEATKAAAAVRDGVGAPGGPIDYSTKSMQQLDEAIRQLVLDNAATPQSLGQITDAMSKVIEKERMIADITTRVHHAADALKGPIGDIKAMVYGVSKGFEDWAASLSTFTGVSERFASMTKGFFEGMETSMVSSVESVLKGQATVKDAIRAFAADLISSLLHMVAQIIVMIPLMLLFNVLSGGGLALGGLTTTTAAIGGIAGLLASIAGFKTFAEGGVINRPTMALMGEAGPEAVVPLSGGRSIPVTFQGGGSQSTVTQDVKVEMAVVNQQSMTPATLAQLKPFIVETVREALSTNVSLRRSLRTA